MIIYSLLLGIHDNNIDTIQMFDLKYETPLPGLGTRAATATATARLLAPLLLILHSVRLNLLVRNTNITQ